jgi:hypothetical protein
MKFIDRAFGATLLAFFTGSLAGTFLIAFSLEFRELMAFLLNTRAIVPVRAASALGSVTVMLLVLANNCVPVVFSFLYPWIIAKVRWTPPIREPTRHFLLTAFSLLTAGLLGFFNLGATLTLVSEIGGLTLLTRLLLASWVHAPLEFLSVLVCVAEPLRIVERRSGVNGIVGSLRADLKLLFICIIGLLASAAIEVFASL